MSVNRRNFLRGAAGTLAAAGTLGVSRPASAADKGGGGTPDPATISVPFLGANQAGVYRPAFVQQAACFAAFRLLVDDSAGLQLLLQTLTSHIQSLSEGSLVASNPPRESEIGGLDSGVLGAQVPPDALTVTVGFGAGVFTDKYGLAAARPRGLTTMPVFASDSPEPDWTGGDLILQVCSNASDSVHHALRDLTRATRGLMQLEWKILGFHSGPRPSGAPRNLFGYKDGIVNPGEDEGLVWIGKDSGQPDWAVGGTFMVVRLIRMLVEFWDRIGISEQNAIIGRDRDSGAPLDGTSETDLPGYAADPDGAVIPLDAHIRLANPRTPETDRSRLLRRGYNYENHGMSRNGNSETGADLLRLPAEHLRPVRGHPAAAGRRADDRLRPALRRRLLRGAAGGDGVRRLPRQGHVRLTGRCPSAGSRAGCPGCSGDTVVGRMCDVLSKAGQAS